MELSKQSASEQSAFQQYFLIWMCRHFCQDTGAFAAVIFTCLLLQFSETRTQTDKPPLVLTTYCNIGIQCNKQEGKTGRVLFQTDDSSKQDDVCRIEKINFPHRSAIVNNHPPYKIMLHGDGTDNFISASFIRNNGQRYFEKHYQAIMESVIPKNISPEKILILDIGANIGIHSLFFASKGYQVHAFEPFPSNFHLLQCSKIANNFTNLKVNNFGLSNRTFKTCMEVQPRNQGTAQIQPKNQCSEKGLVYLKTLDDYVEQNLRNQEVFMVKIDVEGHEIIAWQGGQNFLRENPPKYIFSEVSPKKLHDFGKKVTEYFEMMAKFGYKGQSIKHQHWINGPPFSDQLENIHMLDVKFVHNSVLQM
eukprot:TRINITY_DN4406_c0_g2_i1.p1 TRINITY_DN4406_c0_g2~~TRINITY_DN4406_c0_g2_i1.p1  ORF type:complete len:363 (-),score=29.54 TRINITY_DN4406_c0_g2_i1:221-1309(-)